jgi:hypothetical protein
MTRPWSVALVALLVAGACVGAQRARAAEPEASAELQELRLQLDRMRARQDAIESENASLREEIAELRDGTALRTDRAAAVAPQELAGRARAPQATSSGFEIASRDATLSLRGYAQVLGGVFDSRLERPDHNGDFAIRRSRLDFIAELEDTYQLFIEFEGGISTSPASPSDFGLIEARLNWKLKGDALQLRMGKIATPFSNESFRSSRDLDTIERFIALNSILGLPGVDAQFGAMLHGEIGADRRIGYYLGAFNGNGRLNDNLSDDNGAKEIVAKLTYAEGGFSGGLGLDYSREEAQELALSSLAFDPFVSVPVEGRRLGVSGDALWEAGRWSLRSEALFLRFAAPDHERVSLVGGFLQPAVFLRGDKSSGIQALLRAEIARLDADTGNDGDTLLACTLGANWFVNPHVRVQLNAILQHFDGASQRRGFSGSKTIPMLLTSIQFKF